MYKVNMHNRTETNSTVLKDPKFWVIANLLRLCFHSNTTFSEVIDAPTNLSDGEENWCPRTFDGFACWDQTPPLGIAKQECPGFVVGFDYRRYVYKECMRDGTWSVHPETNKAWTNYTSCVDVEDLDFRSMVNNIYVIGYSISEVALVLSLIIFLFFKSIRCTRIKVHMHLFFSFALNNNLWIIWYKTVVNDATVVQDNGEWCQFLHIIANYFMVTTYIWMFCEGLHLHISLVVVFVKEDLAMKVFVALGWGMSFVIVMAYAVTRYFIPGASERCWMEHSDAFWIIVVPVLISLAASFVFLIKVVRVLVKKLSPSPNQRSIEAAKKAARAALILIPLFGLHYILIPFRPQPDTPGEKAYQIVSAILTSLQGLCVAILFCFTNQEVISAGRSYFGRALRNSDAITMAGTTAGESYMNTREHVVLTTV